MSPWCLAWNCQMPVFSFFKRGFWNKVKLRLITWQSKQGFQRDPWSASSIMMWSKGCVCVRIRKVMLTFLVQPFVLSFSPTTYSIHPPPPASTSLPFLPRLIDFIKEITLTGPRPPHSLPLCSQVVFTIFLYGKSLRNVEEVGVSFRSMNLMWLAGWGWGGGGSCSNISQSFRYLVKGGVGFRLPEAAGLWRH